MKNTSSLSKKRALLFLGLILILLIGSLVSICLMQTPPGKTYTAYIYTDGQQIHAIDLATVTASYSLTIETEGGGYNVVEIHPGKIAVTDASCPDHVCVNQGFIHSSMLPITCLPNKLVIQLEENSSLPKPDSITY